MVLIQHPPPRIPARPAFRTLKAGTFLVRLFDPSRHAQTALTFRHFGPLLRFDHQSSRNSEPAHDPNRGIYYASLKFSGCLVEVFGDTGIVDSGEWHVARPKITGPLRLLNLQGSGAMRAGSVSAIGQTSDHHLAQAWARYFYEEPIYRGCDGVIYSNAHNGDSSIALFERAAGRLDCPASSVIRLDHPGLRPEILTIAHRNNMICLP